MQQKSKLSKLKKGLVYLFTKPRLIGIILLGKMSPLFPDKPYVELMYWLNMGKKLNLKNPVTFNEKLQWLKLYNHNPEYTVMVDKVKAKEYVAKLIGEEHIIPTLGVWDDPDDIDFDALPNQFVLKCNHNSGTGMCICRDKSKLDIEKVKAELRKGLKENYYMRWREWPYKNVPRKILAEKFMVDESGTELKDYKVFCMNGEPEIIEVDYGRFTNHMRNLYDKDWHLIEMEIQYPKDASHVIPRPEKLEEMLQLARTLAKDIPHVRADFYSINGALYWGELTFCHGAGMEHFKPETWNEKLGKLIVLPPPISGNCKRYLIIEEGYALLIEDHEIDSYKALNDYKIFCFNGEPKVLFVASDRANKVCFDYYDMNLKHLDLKQGGDNYHGEVKLPKHFEEMKELAAKISQGIPHVRTDFYEINDKVYFGELTFFDSTGMAKFSPEEWDEKLGKLIVLPPPPIFRLSDSI